MKRSKSIALLTGTTTPVTRDASERSSAGSSRRPMLLIGDEALSPALPDLAARAGRPSPDLAARGSRDFDDSPTAHPASNGGSAQQGSRRWLSDHRNPIYGQVRQSQLCPCTVRTCTFVYVCYAPGPECPHKTVMGPPLQHSPLSL